MRRHFCLLSFLVCSFSAYAQKQGQGLIDSFVVELERAAHDTDKILLLERISFTYSTIDPATGLIYGRKSLSLSEHLNYARGVAISCIDIGANHAAASAFDSALSYYERAKAIYRQTNDRRGIAAVYSNASLVHQKKGNYPAALESGFRALDMLEDVGDKYAQAVTLENIGVIYSRKHDYSKTISYYTSAFNIYRDLGNKGAMARNLGNAGIVQDALGDFDKALISHQQSLAINEKTGNLAGVLINLANIGYVYSHKKQYDLAVTYQERALQMSREAGDKSNVAINSGNLGETYLAMVSTMTGSARRKCLQEAIVHLEQAVNICKAIGFTGPLAEFSQFLSEAYKQAGEYRKALEYYQVYRNANDSLHSVENSMKIAELETKREVALKEKDILLKDKTIQIHKLQLAKKRNERVLYIVTTILLILALAVIYRVLQKYRKSHRTLTMEKEEHLKLIEYQVKRIEQQTNVLKDISHMQAHNVRGPVASILGLVQLFNLDDYSDPTNKIVLDGVVTATERLDSAVQEVIRRENNSR